MRKIPWYAIMVLLAGSCYGLISPILKGAYGHGFSAAEATDAQYVIGMLVLWCLVPIGRKKYSRHYPKRQWIVLLVLALSGAGTSYTYYNALTYLPASLAIVLLFQFAWIVMVIHMLVSREIPSLPRWIGAGLIILGTVLAVGLLEESLGRFPLWTLIYGLLSAFCYAVTLYGAEFVDSSTSPYLRSAIIITVGTIVILFAFPPTFVHNLHHIGGMLLWGLLMAVFSQILPPILMMIAIPRTGGRMAGVLGSVELPVAVLGAWLLLGEKVSALRWLGVVLILAGIVVSEWQVGKKSKQGGGVVRGEHRAGAEGHTYDMDGKTDRTEVNSGLVPNPES